MKAQGSIEFILLLVGVTAFSVLVVSIYLRFTSSEAGVFAALSSPAAADAGTGSAAGRPYLSLYMPSESYVGQLAHAYLVAYLPDGYNVSNVSIGESGLNVLPLSYLSEASPVIASIPILPSRGGINSMTVSLRISNSSSAAELESIGTTFTSNLSGPAYQPPRVQSAYAYIDRENESLVYGLSRPQNTSVVLAGSSCTRRDARGTLYGIREQCGDASWQVRAYDGYCYTMYGATRTYCYYSRPSGKSTQMIDYAYEPSYNISVKTSVLNYSMVASLSSSRTASQLLLGNTVAGTAEVSGNVIAYGTNPSQDFIAIGASNGLLLANMSYYSALQQYLGNLAGILSFYNNTEIEGPQLSSINASLYTYDSYVNSSDYPEAASPCYLGASGSLVCPPLQEFIYPNITEQLGLGFSINTSVYADGSRITIR